MNDAGGADEAAAGIAARDDSGTECSRGPERDEGDVATDLVRRIQRGDAGAEAALFERYRRGLLYLLRRLGAATEEAEDLLQETYRVVLERLRARGLEEPAGLVGFVRGTARNLYLAERRRRLRLRLEYDATELRSAADHGPDPLSAAIREQEAVAVRRLVRELANDRDREILYRFYLGEEDKGAICSDLDLSSLHFNRVIFRARQRFRELFEASRVIQDSGSVSSAGPIAGLGVG